VPLSHGGTSVAPLPANVFPALWPTLCRDLRHSPGVSLATHGGDRVCKRSAAKMWANQCMSAPAANL